MKNTHNGQSNRSAPRCALRLFGTALFVMAPAFPALAQLTTIQKLPPSTISPALTTIKPVVTPISPAVTTTVKPAVTPISPTLTTAIKPTATVTALQPLPPATISPVLTTTVKTTVTPISPTLTTAIKPTATVTAIQPLPTATLSPTLTTAIKPTATATAIQPLPTATLSPTLTTTIKPTATVTTIQPLPTATHLSRADDGDQADGDRRHDSAASVRHDLPIPDGDDQPDRTRHFPAGRPADTGIATPADDHPHARGAEPGSHRPCRHRCRDLPARCDCSRGARCHDDADHRAGADRRGRRWPGRPRRTRGRQG